MPCPKLGLVTGRKITVCQDQGLKPHLAFLQLDNADVTTENLCVLPAQHSYFGGGKPEEAGSQQTPTVAQLSHSCELAAGKEWGTWFCPQFAAADWEQLQ